MAYTLAFMLGLSRSVRTRRLESLSREELDTLTTTLMQLLPAGLNAADVSLLDRLPNMTVYVDVGIRVTASAVVAAVTNATFITDIGDSLGMRATLLRQPYLVNSRVETLPSPSPAPPSAPPNGPSLDPTSTSATMTAASSEAAMDANTIAYIAAAVLGGLCLVMGVLALWLWWRKQRGVKQLAVRQADDVGLLRGEMPRPNQHSSDDAPAAATMLEAPAAIAQKPAKANVSARRSEPGSRATGHAFERFTATIRPNSAGQFFIQLMQEEEQEGMQGGGDILISNVSEIDVPDDRAKLSEGDVVRQVNSCNTAGMSLHAVQQMLVGSGSVVELTLERKRGVPTTNSMRITVEAMDEDEAIEHELDTPPVTPIPIRDTGVILDHAGAPTSASHDDALARHSAALTLLQQMGTPEPGWNQMATEDLSWTPGPALAAAPGSAGQSWVPGQGHVNPRFATSNADGNLDRTRNNSALLRV